MDPILVLMQEHRLIEQVLDALEAWTENLPEDTAAQTRELARFVEFIQGFADAYHHAKEEEILFVAMVEAGFPKDQGPIAVMLFEHDQGRELIAPLEALAKSATPWTESERQTVAENAGRFCALLRPHIQKEDQVLYPMAQARISPEAFAKVADQIQAREEAGERSGERARWRELARAVHSRD